MLVLADDDNNDEDDNDGDVDDVDLFVCVGQPHSGNPRITRWRQNDET